MYWIIKEKKIIKYKQEKNEFRDAPHYIYT